jgi:putative ABC transport system ATP-binding protein
VFRRRTKLNEANNVLIKLEAVDKIFYADGIETHALSGIRVEIKSGEYLAITGPSGCGLSLIGHLDSPTKGQY